VNLESSHDVTATSVLEDIDVKLESSHDVTPSSVLEGIDVSLESSHHVTPSGVLEDIDLNLESGHFSSRKGNNIFLCLKKIFSVFCLNTFYIILYICSCVR
jgi:hypothetical protein